MATTLITVTVDIQPRDKEKSPLRAATLEIRPEKVDDKGNVSYGYKLWGLARPHVGTIEGWPRGERSALDLVYSCLAHAGIGGFASEASIERLAMDEEDRNEAEEEAGRARVASSPAAEAWSAGSTHEGSALTKKPPKAPETEGKG